MKWNPDLDLNSPWPMDNPDNPSRHTRARNKLLMDMLLEQGGDFGTMYKIMSAYPYLREEYRQRIADRRREMARWADEEVEVA
jgi:hypothetical protein